MRRHHHAEPLLVQGDLLQASSVGGNGQDGAVDTAVAQHLDQVLGLVLDDVQLQIRIFVPHQFDQCRQNVGGDGGDDADGQGARQGAGGAMRVGEEVFCSVESCFRQGEKLFAGWGDDDAPGGTFNKLNVKTRLQRNKSLRQ